MINEKEYAKLSWERHILNKSEYWKLDVPNIKVQMVTMEPKK